MGFNHGDLVTALVIGCASGLVYFLLLWLSIRVAWRTCRPGFVLLGSFVSRSVLLVIVFFTVLQLFHWTGLSASMMGFLLMRTMLLRATMYQADRSGTKLL